MVWNKLYTRKMTDEEKETYGEDHEFIWDGVVPEVGQYVIVKRYADDEPSIDKWDDEYDGTLGFYYNNDIEECYWVPVPEFGVVEETEVVE